MGLKLTLPKTDNYIGFDFIDAYWSIDNISFENYNGEAYVLFSLNTYASRDAKYLNGNKVNSIIPIGGSYRDYYETILHRWLVQVKAETVFSAGIPLSEAEQKEILYAYVKEFSELPFEDVFEEEKPAPEPETPIED